MPATPPPRITTLVGTLIPPECLLAWPVYFICRSASSSALLIQPAIFSAQTEQVVRVLRHLQELDLQILRDHEFDRRPAERDENAGIVGQRR